VSELSSSAEKSTLSRQKRIILFIICVALISLVFSMTIGSPVPSDVPHVLMYTALLMISFVTLFLEHFFTTPTDVLASTISILLLMSPLTRELSRFGPLFWAFFAYNLLLAITSLSALMLLNNEDSAHSVRNRISTYLKRFSVTFGNGRFLFLMLFFLTLVFYVDSQSSEFLIMAGFSIVIVFVNPIQSLFPFGDPAHDKSNDIGKIIGVQSKNVFLAKLYAERSSVKRFDLVGFRFKHSIGDEQGVYKGVIIDNFVLDEQQWIKILSLPDIPDSVIGSASTSAKANVVYKAEGPKVMEYIGSLVGVVLEGSNISTVRFEYDGRKLVNEGTLLQIKSAGKKVLYQVVQGITAVKNLESKNEAGYVVGEAIQLGEWNKDTMKFEKYGWVPDVNNPVFLADDVPSFNVEKGEVVIGNIPGTKYPVIINLETAVTHHLSILGVTGCGKSVFCRNLLKEIIGTGTKVICVDFTNEYRTKCTSLDPKPIVPVDKQDELFKAIDILSDELEKFANQQDKTLVKKNQDFLKSRFVEYIGDYLKSENKLSLFELPDVSNTTGILEYTKWFFKGLFEVARKQGNFGKRVCVVLEEAHTVIPEWNFIGVEDRKAQPLVNSISQIALQGRKYNVGFIVIAQRTANVSKTILTQCNSIIAFQQFDRTSADYLTNYMGNDMVAAIPALKFRQAIAVGKAFRSGNPIIFEVPEIKE
jgi:uncharacterized protein